MRWGTGSSKSTLEWDATATATSYSVYRGTVATLAALLDATTDSCQVGTTAATSYGGLTTPGGTLDWYLVRASNGAGAGTAGFATGVPRVHDSSGACP